MPSHEGTLAPTGKCDWTCPSFGPPAYNPNGKIDRLSHFCTGHGSVVRHIGATGWIRLNLCFLRPTRVHNQHASRSVKTFSATVCKTVRPVLSDRWPISPPLKGHSPPNFRPVSVVAKRLAGWTKMPLGTEVGLGPGDFVLDGHPSCSPQK